MELVELLRTNQAEFAREARKIHLRREYDRLRKLDRQQPALASPTSRPQADGVLHAPQARPQS